jgi:hypothetical protein
MKCLLAGFCGKERAQAFPGLRNPLEKQVGD